MLSEILSEFTYISPVTVLSLTRRYLIESAVNKLATVNVFSFVPELVTVTLLSTVPSGLTNSRSDESNVVLKIYDLVLSTNKLGLRPLIRASLLSASFLKL